ncbi:hypothetical protein Glove_519g55 [Diversispora epigaea]|uniref:Uncharacterized protein n=1 Tax=Diversispora epigaea TaxID=1348612 RepID=A0A397GF25_9GLOM|nr:hypothetical protein Glove_519g55 [Diversispora epigaea]
MYLLSRKENYEESDITRLQLQFPKLHLWMFHICSSIREFGAINGYTTETYESLHKDYVKKPYKLINKKEIEKQIMKIIRRKAIITESSSKEIPKTPIALKYSKKLYEFCIQNAEIYIQTRMNDPDLEKEMKLGFEKFLKCLDTYLNFYNQKLSEHEEIDIKFRIYSGVMLKYGAKMRANNKFHKRPIFSNIAVKMNPDEIFEYTSDNGVCFAQVLLIIEIIMNYEELMHLTLVQWYDFKSSVNPYLYEYLLLEKTNIFNLIEIEAINDIIHIISQIDIKFRIYSGVMLKYGAKMRANNKFHKRPIFSNIAVKMNPDEIFEYTSDNGVCFAQVLLIIEIIMNYEELMHLTLVQWYDFKSSIIPAAQIQNPNAEIPNPKSQIIISIFCRNPKSQIPNPKY